MASIKRIDGRKGPSFKITVTTGRDEHYKQIRHFMTWRPDKPMNEQQMMKAVRHVADEFERDIEYGFQVDNKQTFNEYASYVIDLKACEGAAKNTLEVYRKFMVLLSPKIGSRRMLDIRPQHLTMLYRELERQTVTKARIPVVLNVDPAELLNGGSVTAFGRRCGIGYHAAYRIANTGRVSLVTAEKIAEAINRPVNELFTITRLDTLSPATIRRVHNFISVVFAQAEKEMIVKYNPAARATLPRKKDTESEVIQPEQIARIVAALEEEPIKWRALFYLMLVTGARRGELLALKWSKVDWESQQIKIDASISYIPGIGVYEGPTKTRGVRYVPIPSESIALLKQHRREQIESRLMYGPEWTDSDYVFTQEKGGPMVPTVVNTKLTMFSSQHGLPHLHPHIFRHTAASILISQGVDVLTVSKMLGHATTTTTMNIYGHAIDEAKAKAADCLADVILQRKKA